ncbi:GlxA family transcriptional regulator [Cryptosporangium aurantiacum]|uniref:Transcriptional regulator, AraC family with amidase-like domain n=1 Tax=Cryptosporangium aurantiacum TaxID=134849 RepID=A0A1M7RIH2_9ACTN|nr:DJ-1/PfpI family protein [Cryptosporangium aurantiacum]SHN45878.1 transcriptional regulator, AraC family with amidase-like domain [Cryptosporangium aurantiacum]
MKDVLIVVYDGVTLLDVAGPLQVLHAPQAYRTRLASPDGAPVTTDVGVPLAVDTALSAVRTPPDTLLVPGDLGLRSADGMPDGVVDQLTRIAPDVRRVASVCGGALLLAAAGLLDGRRATTHWALCEVLAQRFPAVTVEPDAIVVRDGSLLTSAGVTAGIDLSLALLEEDLGPDVARTVARWLVVFLQRPGGQAQYGIPKPGPVPRNPALRAAVDAVAADPAAPHTLESLAQTAAVSARHLGRLFRRELNATPAQYVESTRLAAARTLLESSDAVLPAVARQSGFGSDETLRRVFLKHLGIPPHAYRERFHPFGRNDR